MKVCINEPVVFKMIPLVIHVDTSMLKLNLFFQCLLSAVYSASRLVNNVPEKQMAGLAFIFTRQVHIFGELLFSHPCTCILIS